MDARPEVCGGIRFVQAGNPSCKYVVPGHDRGTQMMTVGPQCGYQKEDGHSGKQEGACPEVIVPVLEKEIENRNGDVPKPEKVGNNKQFTKRNVVIERYVDLGIVAGHSFLQIGKP